MAEVVLPLRWVAAITVASAAACFPVALGVVVAGIRFYERLVGPLNPAEAFNPPCATEATPAPHTAPRPLP